MSRVRVVLVTLCWAVCMRPRPAAADPVNVRPWEAEEYAMAIDESVPNTLWGVGYARTPPSVLMISGNDIRAWGGYHRKIQEVARALGGETEYVLIHNMTADNERALRLLGSRRWDAIVLWTSPEGHNHAQAAYARASDQVKSAVLAAATEGTGLLFIMPTPPAEVFTDARREALPEDDWLGGLALTGRQPRTAAGYQGRLRRERIDGETAFRQRYAEAYRLGEGRLLALRRLHLGNVMQREDDAERFRWDHRIDVDYLNAEVIRAIWMAADRAPEVVFRDMPPPLLEVPWSSDEPPTVTWRIEVLGAPRDIGFTLRVRDLEHEAVEPGEAITGAATVSVRADAASPPAAPVLRLSLVDSHDRILDLRESGAPIASAVPFHWTADPHDTMQLRVRAEALIDGLNEAWLRRYGQWDEVMPGKKPGRPYTEMMAWEHFLTWRACEHARARGETLRAVDTVHPVTLHGGAPSTEYGGGTDTTPLDRGNDWFFADVLDGVGCSSFPKWFHIDDADFGLRIDAVRSAARGKAIWLSELQGGRSAAGFDIHDPVDALSQQRWLWNGLACGADTILFWCWRDEVFTCEAGGYGLIGLDGLAEERVAAMRRTGEVLRAHGALLAEYQPDDGAFGVLFSPQSYYYYGAQDGHAGKPQAALRGICRALVRNSIPYTVVEEDHLDLLTGLRVLYLPRATALAERTREALIAFVRGGGTLVAESECGAFTDTGLYHYPEDRFLAREANLCERGRRRLTGPTLALTLEGRDVAMPVTQWLTPLREDAPGRVLSASPDGPLAVVQPLGEGRIVYCGTYPSDAYCAANNDGFEAYVAWIAGLAGCSSSVEVLAPARSKDAFLYVKTGISGNRRVVFVFFDAGQSTARLRFHPGILQAVALQDIISGSVHELTRHANGTCDLTLACPDWRFAVLVEQA